MRIRKKLGTHFLVMVCLSLERNPEFRGQCVKVEPDLKPAVNERDTTIKSKPVDLKGFVLFLKGELSISP